MMKLCIQQEGADHSETVFFIQLIFNFLCYRYVQIALGLIKWRQTNVEKDVEDKDRK